MKDWDSLTHEEKKQEMQYLLDKGKSKPNTPPKTYEQILNALFAQWSLQGTLTYQDMLGFHEQIVLLKDYHKSDLFKVVNTTNPEDMPKKRRHFERVDSNPQSKEEPSTNKGTYLCLTLVGISILTTTITLQFMRAKAHNVDPSALITFPIGLVIVIGLLCSLLGTLGLYFSQKD